MFLHDAEVRSADWKRRHSPGAIARLGVWRWKGIQQHATRILEILSRRAGDTVIDFGGYDGPLGFGSVVVDPKDPELKTLADVNVKGIQGGPQPGAVFTSHTLEHVEDLRRSLDEMKQLLVAGGDLIVHVPAWTCERWRHTVYCNPNQDETHRRTFCLWRDYLALPGTNFIDRSVANAGFEVDLAEYCGDDSIIVFARKEI